MSRWQSADPWLNDFEKRAAVYAIYDAHRGLFYVGETNNLKRRFSGHNFILARYSLSYYNSSWPDEHFTDVKVKFKYSRRFGEEAMSERRLIRRLKPVLNQRGLLNG